MTRKEAVKIVEKEYIEYYESGASIWEALKMVADALKNEDAVIDKVLEIIDTVNDDLDFGTKEKGVALSIKEKVLALQWGDTV